MQSKRCVCDRQDLPLVTYLQVVFPFGWPAPLAYTRQLWSHKAPWSSFGEWSSAVPKLTWKQTRSARFSEALEVNGRARSSHVTFGGSRDSRGHSHMASKGSEKSYENEARSWAASRPLRSCTKDECWYSTQNGAAFHLWHPCATIAISGLDPSLQI